MEAGREMDALEGPPGPPPARSLRHHHDGEQYTGWLQIPAKTSAESPESVLARVSGLSVEDVQADPKAAYRKAAKRTHPDYRGGPTRSSRWSLTLRGSWGRCDMNHVEVWDDGSHEVVTMAELVARRMPRELERIARECLR